MQSLRQVVFELRSGERRHPTEGIIDRRGSPDRRSGERRSSVSPLESRENRLRFAAQAAGFGTYDVDCLTGDSVWSPELRAIAGLPPDTRGLASEQVEALVHPDDRQLFLDRMRASLDPTGKGEFDGEYRLVRPDGSIRWVKAKGRTYFTGDGAERRALAATGIVMDVTAGRTTEHALADSLEDRELAMRAAGIGTWHWDLRNGQVELSERCRQLFGIGADEALNFDRIMAAIHPDDRDGIQSALKQALESGEEYRFEKRVIWGDGSIHWLSCIGRELYEETGGKAVGMRGISIDVTERKLQEEALRRSTEDMELAVRGANIGIWHFDLESGQLEWSEQNYRLFGVPVGEPVNYERFLAAVHPDDRDKVRRAGRRTKKEGGEYNAEFRVVSSDGGIRWIAGLGRYVNDLATGRAVGVRGINIDITERKRREEALQDRNEQLEMAIEERTRELVRSNAALERSNLELQQFAFVAAHDLQTPLRSISGFAQLLQKDYRGRLDAQADDWLDLLIRSVRRMHDVVQDILAYSRVESRGNAFQPTDLDQLMGDVLATLDAPVRETAARITWDPLPTVTADRTQLAQVLQNLIDNALKYRGSEAPRIHVSVCRQGDEWLFSVRDNGIGIPEKHLDHIFDIFRRLHGPEEYPGTGIGLAICRRVIHRHGGRIWAESEPGKGSTFHFTLPVGRPVEP